MAALVLASLALPRFVLSADAGVAFRGEVASVTTCYDPLGYAFVIGTSTDSYIFVTGLSQSIPRAHALRAGDEVSGIATSSVTCDTDGGAGIQSRTGLRVTYYGVPLSTTPPPVTLPQTGSSGTGTGTGSGSSFFSQLQNLFRSFVSPSGQGSSSAQRTSPSPGATFPTFGGKVTAPIICTSPPGAVYTHIAGPVPKPIIALRGSLCEYYLSGLPQIPGQNTFGNLTGALLPCWVGDVIVGYGYLCLDSGTGGAGSGGQGQQGAGQDAEEARPPVQCADASLAEINFKRGVGQDLTPGMEQRMKEYSCGAGSDMIITEGCGDITFTGHVNYSQGTSCHNNCTCVDIASASRDYSPNAIKRNIEAGKAAGMDVVFETDNREQYDAALKAGVPAANLRYFPNCSTGKRPCVTAPHYSGYCPRVNGVRKC